MLRLPPCRLDIDRCIKGSASKYVGYVESVEAAMAVIKQYELETTTKLSCFKSDKMFGAGGE